MCVWGVMVELSWASVFCYVRIWLVLWRNIYERMGTSLFLQPLGALPFVSAHSHHSPVCNSTLRVFLLIHVISCDQCREQMETQKSCLPMLGCYVTRKISFVMGLRNHWFFRTFVIRKGKMSFWFVTYPAATRYLYVHSKNSVKPLLHFKLSIEDIILS